MSAVYVLRGPDIVHDTIDGETVIVDMEKGAYYRLDGAAAVAWQTLSAGATDIDIARHLAARYAAADDALADAAARFLRELHDYGLIEPQDRPQADAVAVLPSGGAALAPFPGIAVHRFTDLEELLFLDPVHEVDETGWPAQPPER